MPGFNHNLSISDEAFEKLNPIEQDIVRRLETRHPGPTVPPRRPIKFTMLETPESASRAMDKTNDVGQGYDVTEFSTPLRLPRKAR